MKSLPRMPWFPRDYLASTRHFSLAERGAYSDLLFMSWEMGPLPGDPIRLARLLGCNPQEFEHIWEIVREKFCDCMDGTGRLINVRLEQHRQQVNKWREQQAKLGRKGGRAKRKDDKVIDFPSKNAER